MTNLTNKYKEFFSSEDFPIECDEGWYGIIEDMLKTFRNQKLKLKISQIKEKFGFLRVYFDIDDLEFTTDRIKEHNMAEQIIMETEKKSQKTCEICGKEGKYC